MGLGLSLMVVAEHCGYITRSSTPRFLKKKTGKAIADQFGRIRAVITVAPVVAQRENATSPFNSNGGFQK
jgi:hypothetical protein